VFPRRTIADVFSSEHLASLRRHDRSDGSSRRAFDHADLLALAIVLPSDYQGYGGVIERWADPEMDYPDCSCGCKWAAWLEGGLGSDWLVCCKPDGPRRGLLTFEHQAGLCFEPVEDIEVNA